MEEVKSRAGQLLRSGTRKEIYPEAFMKNRRFRKQNQFSRELMLINANEMKT
jgi:hypothetical protein